jgi:signal peptide peptidase SppA
MNITDILSQPWAILPDMKREIDEIYRAHLRGDKIDLSAVEAKLGRPLDNEQDRYAVTPDGVAVIPVQGVIAKRMNMFSNISGGASSELISKDFQEALTRLDVKGILLEIDSPGGAVDGTQQLALEIFRARGTKPIITLVNGMMASAAAYIGAAADKVYINGDLVQTGSIGVVASHVDISRAEEAAGIKTTEIYSGKYKRIASQYAPLSAEGKQSIQDMLDYVYAKFVDDMATFRGMSSEDTLAKMADGKLFIGSQGIEAGLVDGIKSKNEVIALIVQQSDERIRKMENEFMAKLTLDQIRADRPDLVTALLSEGAETGAKTELARIQAVEAVAIPGHDELIARLKYDGKTTGAEAAIQVIQAEQSNQKKVLKTLEAESVKPAALSMEAAPVETAKTPEEKWEADADLRQSFGNDQPSYLAYLKAEKEGRIRVFTKKPVE